SPAPELVVSRQGGKPRRQTRGGVGRRGQGRDLGALARRESLDAGRRVHPNQDHPVQSRRQNSCRRGRNRQGEASAPTVGWKPSEVTAKGQDLQIGVALARRELHCNLRRETPDAVRLLNEGGQALP